MGRRDSALAVSVFSTVGVLAQGLSRFAYTAIVGRLLGASDLAAVNTAFSVAILLSLTWPTAAGNAAVTNYPGKVRGKISRAVGRISRRDRTGAERDVTVVFTVTASGALGGLSIARSSGSPSLDLAALAAVRRAAPFPAIPEGAGRKTWQFTIPLGLAK